MIQRHVWVAGRVQGVGFRASTLEAVRNAQCAVSQGRGIRGFVRNLEDGRVEAVFSGEPELVLALVAWCRKGPPSARVSALEVREEPVDAGLPVFSLQR